MGQKVKIADLKKFDVFKWDKSGLQYIVFEDGHCCSFGQGYRFQISSFIGKNEKVEVVGKMEFIEEEQIVIDRDHGYPTDANYWE